MDVNYTLKFSWGHIIALVAMIFISYVSFMGLSYLTDGNFLLSGIGVFVVDIVLILFFLLPQILKGTEKHFHRNVIFERILIFLSPLFFLAIMFPYCHFWTVYDNREKIETTFSESVSSIKEMFVSYEKYAQDRLDQYDKRLRSKRVGQSMRRNKMEALRLQIADENFRHLKESAFDWIDKAQTSTVWNVFMLGNVNVIQNTLESWNASLNDFSSKKMSDESPDVKAFLSSEQSVLKAKRELNDLHVYFETCDWPNVLVLLSLIAIYFLLMFPYMLQHRNTKSVYRLVGSEKKSSVFIEINFDDEPDKNQNDDKMLRM